MLTSHLCGLAIVGKIVRLGPDLYSIDDAAATKTIYGHGTQYIKGDWYKIWQIPTKSLPANLFALQDIKQHSTVRRMYANVYAMSSLVAYEPYVDNCMDILLRQLYQASKQGQTVDMAKWFQWYAFDVIGEITVCRPLCCFLFSPAPELISPLSILSSSRDDSASWKPRKT